MDRIDDPTAIVDYKVPESWRRGGGQVLGSVLDEVAHVRWRPHTRSFLIASCCSIACGGRWRIGQVAPPSSPTARETRSSYIPPITL
ncbi:MAG: hypothetical protein QM773_18730 [Hyphomonadaceae bacterium]